jgi:hypothetical protein
VSIHLALVFKDFAAWCRSSCVGLNVAGFATAKVLRDAGIDVHVFPVRHNVDIVTAIDHYNETHHEQITHCVISAPWLSVYDLEALVKNFTGTKFAILSHSNVGFLQADPEGVRLLRAYHELSKNYSNLHVGGNCNRFTDWMMGSYGGEIVHLPNLYPVGKCKVKTHTGVPIRIGAFGALRPYKNFMTAAGAATVIQRRLGLPVEFHMSGGGEEIGNCISNAINQVFENTGVTLIKHDWQYWDDFVELVGRMDLLLQPSFTESFNMVTADGIHAGVPSVVGPAISWAPDDWKADPDNALDIASVGLGLLKNPNSNVRGFKALRRHNARAIEQWLAFLGTPRKWYEKMFSRLMNG